MQAGEAEVLDALRRLADQGALPGEWTEVDIDAARGSLLKNMREDTLQSILRTLAIKGDYEKIDDSRGRVKM
jgi:hypothetical protein